MHAASTKTQFLAKLREACSWANYSQDTYARNERLFRTFLVLKVGAPFALRDSSIFPGFTIAVVLAVIAASLPRFYLPGLVFALLLSGSELVQTWPFTINHVGLEFVILTLLSLASIAETTPLTATQMIQLLMLSVWVFSGFHKLFDGYYLNAEFFGLEALASDESPMGRHFRQIFHLVGPLFENSSLTPKQPVLECCTVGSIYFPTWKIGLIAGMAWATIITEVFLPLTLFSNYLRKMGIASLFAFQALIAYFSKELDFAFTAFAILVLFVPKVGPWAYPLLATSFLVVQPW